MERMMSKTDRLTAIILAGLSEAGLDRGIKQEYRHGHPGLSDAEIEKMFAAEKIKDYPVASLREARRWLALFRNRLPQDLPDSPPLSPS
jgi:hypothetical protein